MWRVRGKFHWRVGALATGLLTATLWAQPPVPIPPTGPGPVGPGGFAPRTKREIRHQAWRDTFIGRPADFIEPPFGTYVRGNFSMMRSKADPHRFTLYRSDFLDGTDRLSPTGATRFNLMASRLSGWLGPVVIEWSPDQPGLAESRRVAVVAALQGAGLPVIPERVVIGPSVYPGGMGEDAVNYHNVMITRDQQAPASYSVSPTSTSGFSIGGAGGSQ
ncbi:hypothetical protein V5E97_17840 [Singulisphaera sp. Ch08]|uniref:Uncharacterized protein n=1 Tax=Singulisphaera sp. Ch08 TaxID=3120278 RepID=A0AAU7CQW9_9BACT